jgi:hypothetical protein
MKCLYLVKVLDFASFYDFDIKLHNEMSWPWSYDYWIYNYLCSWNLDQGEVYNIMW